MSDDDDDRRCASIEYPHRGRQQTEEHDAGSTRGRKNGRRRILVEIAIHSAMIHDGPARPGCKPMTPAMLFAKRSRGLDERAWMIANDPTRHATDLCLRCSPCRTGRNEDNARPHKARRIGGGHDG